MSAMRSFVRVVVCTSALLVLGGNAASAYNYDTCNGDRKVWDSTTKTFTANTTSFPSGSAWRTSLESAVDAWNYRTPGTRFRFNLAYDSGTALGNDSANRILVTSNYTWNGALGVAITHYDACIWLFNDASIDDVDVLINPAYTWDLTTNPQPSNGGSPYNLALVMIHELGHAMGMKHEDSKMATMNSYYPNSGPLGSLNQVHPHADDVAGDRAGYGTGSTEHDLAASVMERSGTGTSRVITPPATSYKGHASPFKFSISNRGTANQSSVQVRFYLSTDRNITTSDIYLGQATYSMNAGTETTYTANVTVPTSTATGNYYFGLIMDPSNTVIETNEANNSNAHVGTTNVPATSPPKPCFTFTPSYGQAPLDVDFNAACSSDPVGSIVSYSWNFGDGTTGTGVAPTHWYWNSGNYTITLTVTDDSGFSRSTTQYLYVSGNCGGPEPCVFEPAQ